MKLKLVYSHENVKKPILAKIVLKTNLLINIIEAKVTANMGEMIIDIPSEGEQLREVIDYLRSEGVTVKEVVRTIEIDHDRCIACGACVSSCPADAIKQNEDWSVRFIEENCIGCRICVYACPVRVIQALGD
ncbi:MAG: 4Fe-4S binding protein [Nitrososphaerota archaeon]|nr:4Fe-4S binding protein [Nitrososphaerales archaeon]MDW8044903.1 4Fe-4S binding protein [Nitrososphaerota archaeon]